MRRGIPYRKLEYKSVIYEYQSYNTSSTCTSTKVGSKCLAFIVVLMLNFCCCVVNNVVLLYGKVNPSVLIGCFLIGISPYGPFPWKRSKAVYFFCFRKPANSTNKHGASAV